MVALTKYNQEDPKVELCMGKYHTAVHLYVLPWLLGDSRSLDTSSMESFIDGLVSICIGKLQVKLLVILQKWKLDIKKVQ